MGGSSSKKLNLRDNEVIEFTKASNFNQKEVHDLYAYYRHYSSMQTDDGVIDYLEFCQALSIPDSPIASIIFKLFDTNNDNVINFREFLLGCAAFHNETVDKQIKITFRIFDPEDKGYCEVALLEILLNSCLSHLGTVCIPKKVIKEIIKEMMIELGTESEDRITFEEYRSMIYKNDRVLRWFSIDAAKVTEGATLIMKNKLSKKKKSSTYCGR